jgi:hypothetical protein
VNGDSKITNERGLSLVGSLGLLCRYKRFLFVALPALVGPVLNIFFLTVPYFSSFGLIALQARQAAVLGRPSLLVHTNTYTQEGPIGCDYDLEFPSLYKEEGEKFVSSQDHWLDEGLPKELNIFIQRAQKTNRQKTQLFLYTRRVLLTIMYL